MKHAIAIFDVGKTNKKLILFDEQYRILSEESVQLPESKDEDGFACEDVSQLTSFIVNSLTKAFLRQRGFRIVAVNFSGYGASFVHVAINGDVIAPLYNYMKPYPEDLLQKFHRCYGERSGFALQTASPVLGNLNSGLQLFWLKHHRPGVFDRIRYSLHLPQYLSYIISGRPCSDITSVGCHTGLWDFAKQDYHNWVSDEQVIEKLAPIVDPAEMLTASFAGHSIKVGTGLHDSSAALIPYLVKFREPFTLISTGTWCVTLNPFNHSTLTIEELNGNSLCYLQYNGSPVKASTLLIGPVHDEQLKRIAAHFHVQPSSISAIEFEPEIVQDLNLKFGQGDVLMSEWEFPSFDLTVYVSEDEAYHHLMMEIVARQVRSTRFVMQEQTRKVFVDGGFSKNEIFMNLLANAFPGKEIFAANLGQASALGAALVVHEHWNNSGLPSDIVELKSYPIVHAG